MTFFLYLCQKNEKEKERGKPPFLFFPRGKREVKKKERIPSRPVGGA